MRAGRLKKRSEFRWIDNLKTKGGEVDEIVLLNVSFFKEFLCL